MVNVRVTDITETYVDAITDKGEIRIPTRTVIWAAGVKASPFGEVLEKRAGAKLESNGQVIVQPDCSIGGHPEIFAIGDIASFAYEGRPLPGVAQVAMQQGRYVARIIEKRLQGKTETKRFRYFDKGQMAVIGRAKAVAQSGPLRFTGLLAWLAWLFIHLIYIVEFSHRVLVLIRWTYLYVSFNRGARLITGSDRLLAEKIDDEEYVEVSPD